MTSTTAHTAQQISDTLDALRAELYDDGRWLRIEEPTYTYRKRDIGGYYVEYRGLQLGWVVKRHDTNEWAAVTYGSDSIGKTIDHGFTKRADATQCIAMMLTSEASTYREGYDIYWEKRIADEARFAALFAD